MSTPAQVIHETLQRFSSSVSGAEAGAVIAALRDAGYEVKQTFAARVAAGSDRTDADRYLDSQT